MYIKPGKCSQENDTTLMTTATNEVCIGLTTENCYLMNDTFDKGGCKFIKGDFFGGDNEKILGVGWDSPLNPQYFWQRFWGRGKEIDTWWGNKAISKEGTSLIRRGIQGL